MMTGFDDDCAAAAEQVLARSRREQLVLDHLRSTLAPMRAIAAALTAMPDQTAAKPRRNRTIRLRRDDVGELVADDITGQPEPGQAPVADAEATPEAAPEPGGMFAGVFGNLEGT